MCLCALKCCFGGQEIKRCYNCIRGWFFFNRILLKYSYSLCPLHVRMCWGRWGMGSDVSCKPLWVSDWSYSHLNEVTGAVKGILLPPAIEEDLLTHPSGHQHAQVKQTLGIFRAVICSHAATYETDTWPHDLCFR